jgi:hypothetical protein
MTAVPSRMREVRSATAARRTKGAAPAPAPERPSSKWCWAIQPLSKPKLLGGDELGDQPTIEGGEVGLALDVGEKAQPDGVGHADVSPRPAKHCTGSEFLVGLCGRAGRRAQVDRTHPAGMVRPASQRNGA